MSAFCRKFLAPTAFSAGVFLAVFIASCFCFFGKCTGQSEPGMALAAAAGLCFACFGAFLSSKIPFSPGITHVETLVFFALLTVFTAKYSALFSPFLFPGFLLWLAGIGGFAFGGILVFALRPAPEENTSFRTRALLFAWGSFSAFLLCGFFIREQALFRLLCICGGILILFLTFSARSVHGKFKIPELFTAGLYFLLFFSFLRTLPELPGKTAPRMPQTSLHASIMILQRGEEPFSMTFFPAETPSFPPEIFCAARNLRHLALKPDGRRLPRGNAFRFAESEDPFSPELEKTDLFLLDLPPADTLEILKYLKRENLERLKGHLTERGVLVLKTDLAGKASPEKRSALLSELFSGLRSVFADTYRVPGKGILFFASDFPLVKDAETLEKKVPACFEEGTLPPGVFPLLFPLLEKHAPLPEPTLRKDGPGSRIVSFWKDHEFFAGKTGQKLLNALLFIRKYAFPSGMTVLLLAYLLLRYVRTSSSMERKVHFMTFENAFCSFGLLLMSALLFQLSAGDLFARTGFFMLLFSGGCLTAFLCGKKRWKISPFFLACVMILPCLLLFFRGTLLCGGIFFCVFSSGLVFTLQQMHFSEKTPERAELFLPAFCGAALVFPVLFAFPVQSLVFVLPLITLPRLGRLIRFSEGPVPQKEA